MKRRSRTAELVVRPRYSPKTKLFLSGIVAIVLLVGGGALYNRGLYMAGFNSEQALHDKEALKSEITRLSGENQQLRETLARAQRTLQMDQTAYQELNRALKSSSDEIVKLREEVNFYHNIISSGTQATAGVQIQHFGLARTPAAGVFHYKLVLVQSVSHERNVAARVRLVVNGRRGDKDVSLPGKLVSVSFKYFQNVEGDLSLPPDVTPAEVKIEVNTNRGQKVERVYPWPATVANGSP